MSTGCHGRRFDVVTMGRVGVDIYPNQVGVALEDVTTFSKFLGGSATNVAVAAARHDHSAALVTGIGADAFGRYVRKALREFAVADDYVVEVPDWPTPVTFCELFPPDDFPLWFYRFPTAPDLQIGPEDVDPEVVRQAGVFWVTLTGLSQEPSRTSTLAALGARARRGHTVVDLDYRPMFWDTADTARERAHEALAHATVAVGNREECEVAVGTSDPDAAADALLALGVVLAIVKQGPDGVLAATADGRVTVPPVPVDVVNGLGAGDAFGGALCHGLLVGWDPGTTMRFANAAGAIVAGELACSSAMPTTRQVEDRLRAVSHA